MSNEPLPDLPSSDDKEFWGDADVQTGIIPTPVAKRTDHFFYLVRGLTVQCDHCGWGFDLDPGDIVRSGHVYDLCGKVIV